MLSVLAFTVLHLFPSYGTAQITPKAMCLAGFEWSFNSLGQSPCDIATSLAVVCVGAGFTVSPLEPGFAYFGPQLSDSNSCQCNSVYYSLLCACAVCQDRNFILWSAFSANCSVAYNQIFPMPIPSGVRVPHYAYLDVGTGDSFNVTRAQAAGGTESTSVPSATSSLLATPGASSGTSTFSAGAKKRSNGGAIAGGVIGGLVALTLIAVLVFMLRRSRSQSLPPATYGSTMVSQNPVSTVPTGRYYTGPPSPRIYDPDDPRTFPNNINEQAGYNPYSTPSPDLHPQPYPAQTTPNDSGTSPPSFPQYTGSPEP